MRGRPKKEITRDIVYKVRLNAEEDQMLNIVRKKRKITNRGNL